jgi:hypothetical protein
MFEGLTSRCTTPRGEILHQGQRPLRGQSAPASFEQAIERLPAQQAHRDVVAALGFADLVDGHDVRVLQLGRGLSLAVEALDEARFAQQLRMEHLQRQLAFQREVAGPIDGAEAAGADDLEDLVFA